MMIKLCNFNMLILFLLLIEWRDWWFLFAYTHTFHAVIVTFKCFIFQNGSHLMGAAVSFWILSPNVVLDFLQKSDLWILLFHWKLSWKYVFVVLSLNFGKAFLLVALGKIDTPSFLFQHAARYLANQEWVKNDSLKTGKHSRNV